MYFSIRISNICYGVISYRSQFVYGLLSGLFLWCLKPKKSSFSKQYTKYSLSNVKHNVVNLLCSYTLRENKRSTIEISMNICGRTDGVDISMIYNFHSTPSTNIHCNLSFRRLFSISVQNCKGMTKVSSYHRFQT